MLLGAFAGSLAQAQEYSFQYLGVDQGLGNLGVSSFFQDRDGFIWVGTENGVYRYDGTRFRTFLRESGLPPTRSVSLGEAPDGSVLVGGSDGLFRFLGDRFERIPLPTGARISGFSSIRRMGQTTWIGTSAGLLALVADYTGKLGVQPAAPALALNGAAVQVLFVDGSTLWWGCGRSVCRTEQNRTEDVGAAAGMKPGLIGHLLKDREGNLWVSQGRKLMRLRPEGKKFEDLTGVLPSLGIGQLAMDSAGKLLVPTTEGLAIREGERFRMAGRAQGLPGPVYSVFADRDGDVWIGLTGRGVAAWRGYNEWESFTARSGLTSETVFGMATMAGGGLWAGTENGLYAGTKGAGGWSWGRVKGVGDISVQGVSRGPDGQVWLGTSGAGVARVDPAGGGVQWYREPEGVASRFVPSILADRTGTVWAGTMAGLFRLRAGAKQFEPVDPLPAVACWDVEEGPDGTVWVATSWGVWQQKGSGWRHYLTKDGLDHDNVLAVLPDDRGSVWIGYRLVGTITRLTPPERPGGKAAVTQINPAVGPASNITYFLKFDNDRRIWAGTNVGVEVFSASGTHWDRFDQSDGLIWNDCDLHGFVADANGGIWIGTSAGLSRYQPGAVTDARTRPLKTAVTGVRSGTEEMNPAASLTLAYSQAPLSIQYTAVRYASNWDTVFRYRLRPFDSQWHETALRELQFPALSPGNYRFEVEAREPATAWSGNAAVLEFRIQPPWWRTGWFAGSLFSLIGGMLLWFLRRWSRHKEAAQRELEAAVAERTRELAHQYRHDVLTGLPNRLLFSEILEREIVSAERNHGQLAVLFVDLDRFKQVNDTWGHMVGDALLQKVGERLGRASLSTETVARMGGDEFIILVTGIRDKDAAETRGQELLRIMDQPVVIDGKEMFPTASMGIAVYPADAQDTAGLMAAADTAMYRAKGAGKNQVQLFRSGMKEAASRRQTIEAQLRNALKTEGLRLRYQPQYSPDCRLTGFEALVRLVGEDKEISPAEFIPVAEETGMILDLGHWVLQEACRQAHAWHEMGFGDIRMAVNVSAVQLGARGFEGLFHQVLVKTGMDPLKLEIELTETALMRDTGRSASILQRLRAMGIQVALDDFGTGFSTMQYLHQLPVDVVKIDRIFTRDLDGEPSSLSLVDGMVKLARAVGKRVIAEGVETCGQLDILQQIGFDSAQGYLFAMPLTAAEAESLLRRSLHTPPAGVLSGI